MDFDDSTAEVAYRAHVRSVLDRHREQLTLPSAVHNSANRHKTEESQLRAIQRLLADAGLVGVTWPVEFGGQGGTRAQQAIVAQELLRAQVPALINSIGVGMCGPTLIMHGSAAQKQRHLAGLLRADDVWCQLFSEPEAGSDLAALRTRAHLEGDTWVVNGQKVWTSLADISDYGILLARTAPDRPKHAGLTMFVLDMRAPGVTIRPLRQMSGDSGFNEVFLDDVRIPDSDRLGEPHDGWHVAVTTLMNERVSVGGGGSHLGMPAEALITQARERLGDLTPERRSIARQAVGRALVASLGNRYTGYRRLTTLSHGGVPGPEASAGKLAGTAAAKMVADAGLRLLGDDAVYAATADGDDSWQRTQAFLPGLSLGGGTDQVLRNILGERVLGLPPEPRLDKSAPFSASTP